MQIRRDNALKHERSIEQSERRREQRREPDAPVRVSRAVSVLPISDVEVLNLSRSGVAIRTRVPLKQGDRLSFSVASGTPPILAEVISSELDPADQTYTARCRCLLGGFDV